MAPTKLACAESAKRNAWRRAEQAAKKAGQSGRVSDLVLYWQAAASYSKCKAKVAALESSPEGQEPAW